MCHGKLRRFDERTREERRERLWDLFDRETEEHPPPTPIVEREPAPEPEREEVLSGSRRD